jgi:hypothetical protein
MEPFNFIDLDLELSDLMISKDEKLDKKSKKNKCLDEEYWKKVIKIRELVIDIGDIKKNNKIKEEETRTIVRSCQIILENKELLETGLILFKKNRILRFGINLFIKYYITTFKKYTLKKKVG